MFDDYKNFERTDFPIAPRLKPLLYNYDGDNAAYEEDFDKQWAAAWSKDEVNDLDRSLPFLWAVDFIIYHEMAHIILQHSDLYQSWFKKQCSTPSKMLGENIFFISHLMELQADSMAAYMAVQTLREFQRAIGGAQLTTLMQKNMFSYSYYIPIHFILWGKSRKSHRWHANLRHPHPDFRRIMLFDSVRYCLGKGTIYEAEWTTQFKRAFFAQQHAFHKIGATGFANSILNPFSPSIDKYGPDKLKEWQWIFFTNYAIYRKEISKFYKDPMGYNFDPEHRFDDLDLRSIEFISMGEDVKVIHFAFSDSQIANGIVDYFSKTDNEHNYT